MESEELVMARIRKQSWWMRLADLFDDLEINVGVIVNAANYLHSPELWSAIENEMIAHGFSNGTARPIDMNIEEG